MARIYIMGLNPINNLKNYLAVRRISKRPFYKIIVIPAYKCNLSCSYCFAKGLHEKFNLQMSIEDLDKLVEWLNKNRINKLLISGGEPTLYDYFEEMLSLFKRNKIRIVLASNGLFDKNILRNLNKDTIEFCLAHFAEETLAHPELYKLFNNNLKALKGKGIKLGIKYNIYKKSFDNRVLNLARNYSAEVYTGITCPGFKGNSYIAIEEIKTSKGALLDFVKQGRRQGLKVFYSRPFPRCAFNQAEWDYLSPGGVRADCVPVPVINPDLSIFMCLNIFESLGNLSSFPSRDEVAKLVKDRYVSLRKESPVNECKTCSLYKNNKC